jgi:hypothetical protein
LRLNRDSVHGIGLPAFIEGGRDCLIAGKTRGMSVSSQTYDIGDFVSMIGMINWSSFRIEH